MLRVLRSLVLLMMGSLAFAGWRGNMPEGVTPLSHHMHDLHMTIFYVCCGIGLVVFSILFYSLYAYRRSKGAVASDFHEHHTLEIVWTIIPFIILIAMMVPATRVMYQMYDTEKSDMTIKIVGYQWKWRYEYLDHGISFFSNLSTPRAQIENKEPKGPHYLLEVDEPLVVPVGKKIRFVVTANDVIHSWWVPDLGIKRDAIPGFIHESWAKIEKPGTYRGQCAELCGKDHAYMPIVVEALAPEDFEKWVEAKKKAQSMTAPLEDMSREDLMKKGQQVYEKVCAVCHQPTGLGMPPAFPALKGSKVALGPLEKHISVVLHGVKGTGMQAFADQLDDVSLAAVITYERIAWGNEQATPSEQKIVQPKEIRAAREKSQ